MILEWTVLKPFRLKLYQKPVNIWKWWENKFIQDLYQNRRENNTVGSNSENFDELEKSYQKGQKNKFWS